MASCRPETWGTASENSRTIFAMDALCEIVTVAPEQNSGSLKTSPLVVMVVINHPPLRVRMIFLFEKK